MNSVEEQVLPIVEDPDWRITLSDGCQLSVRIWMPANATEVPVPAIVEHLPYRKRDGTVARDEATHPWFAGNGYACLRVDMRGNGDSQGFMDDEYTQQELQDACEVIAWAASQPWCNGKVGMMGISWGGFNALQVAALRPPALKAIISVCSSVDRFADDIHYKGGCLLSENIGWAANMLSYSSRPPDPALVGDDWRRMWLDRLDRLPFLIKPWLNHQTRDAYWKHGSVCENYQAIDAAVLAIGGWHDGYRNTVSHLLTHLQAPVKGIMGPWIHKYPHQAAPQPAIGFLQEAKRWWDRWLKDIDTGVEQLPAFRTWMMDSVEPARWHPQRPGRWVSESCWPADSVKDQRFFFANNAQGRLHLSDTDSGHEIAATVDSAQHCGQASGEFFPFNFGPELPDEQSSDDALSIVFDSQPMSNSIDILGAPVVRLRLSSSASRAFVCVRLCEIRLDGRSALITSGFLNLTHRLSHEDPQRLPVNEVFDVSLVLDQIAFSLPAGHRLRVAVSNAYWPFIWPCAEAGTLTLEQGELQLPCRENVPDSGSDGGVRGNEVEFEPAESAPAWQADTIRQPSSSRDVLWDATSGEVTTEIINDFGENRDHLHGLVSGSITQERWSIHPDDPLSARAHITWQQNGGRDEWEWSTDVDVNMHCDADYFYVTATVVAFEGDSLVYARDFDERIERQFV